MKGYHHPPVGALAAELSAGLLRLRKGYVDTAETLIRLIDPAREYPYEFVVFRLTNYRGPRDKAVQPLPGGTLRMDLLRLMIQISESFSLSTSDYDEPVVDMVAAAKRFHVSMKTLQRWRAELLPSRRIVFPDAKRRVAFLESTLTWFEEFRRESLRRSANFHQLSPAERQDIVRRAGRMATWARCSLAEVCRRIADRNGRAVETIRYTIRQHDAQNPSRAIFPHLLAGVGADDREVIYRCFLNGVSVPVLAQRYGRTRGSVYRIVNEMRAKILLDQPISHIYNPQFELPDAEQTILGDAGVSPVLDAPLAGTTEDGKPASPAPTDADVTPTAPAETMFVSDDHAVTKGKGKWPITIKAGSERSHAPDAGKMPAGHAGGTPAPRDAGAYVAARPARNRRAADPDLPPYLRDLYDTPLLSPQQERELFRRYNYLKFKADQLRKQISLNRVRTRLLRQIETLLIQANGVKNEIVQANLRLVVSIAKKHLGGPQELFELVSDGNVSLMKAVEKFDFARGFRFSTYASWAIVRNFARSIPQERYQLDRHEPTRDEVLDVAAGLGRFDPNAVNLPELRESLDVLLVQLTPRERTILIDHYGLNEDQPAKTLDQLGKSLGLSKERVRQIEAGALQKLRVIMKPQQR